MLFAWGGGGVSTAVVFGVEEQEEWANAWVADLTHQQSPSHVGLIGQADRQADDEGGTVGGVGMEARRAIDGLLVDG